MQQGPILIGTAVQEKGTSCLLPWTVFGSSNSLEGMGGVICSMRNQCMYWAVSVAKKSIENKTGIPPSPAQQTQLKSGPGVHLLTSGHQKLATTV